MKFSDRKIALALLALSLAIYGYYFQGDSAGLRATWFTTRAIVEQHTFEITAIKTWRGGDYAVYEGRTYSNRLPGLSLLGVPPYWLLHSLERDAGADPTTYHIQWRNVRLITFLTCSIPAAGLTALMYLTLRRRGVSQSLAAAMAIAFAFGSTVFPYSGILYNHTLVTASIFAAWFLLDGGSNQVRTPLLASLLLLIAITTDYLSLAPAIVLFALDTFRHRRLSRAATLAVGPLIGVLCVMAYQHAIFGSAFAATYKYEGLFDATPNNTYSYRFAMPDFYRLYLITFQRARGLFYCCPVFAVMLLSIPHAGRNALRKIDPFALFVIGWYTLFLLTYRFWIGGFGVGPRFLMPAFPFLFLLTRHGFERSPRLAWPLAALSVAIMVMVTTVDAQHIGIELKPGQGQPIESITIDFWLGRISRTEGASNGLKDLGFYSALDCAPVVALIALAWWGCWRLREISPEAEAPLAPPGR